LKKKVPYPLDFASLQGLHARLVHNYHNTYQLHANNIEEFQRLQTNQPVPFGVRPYTRAVLTPQKKNGGHFLPAVRTDRSRKI